MPQVTDQNDSTAKRRRLEEMGLTYRHDVRGHERCRVQRGPLPLDLKTREILVGRGYTVYENKDPLDDDVRRMLTRGHP